MQWPRQPSAWNKTGRVQRRTLFFAFNLGSSAPMLHLNMAPNIALVLLTCWVSFSSAIPFTPVPEYIVALSGLPLIGTYLNHFRSQPTSQAGLFVQDDDTEPPGWYDPRANGGQMLDVRQKRAQ